MILSLNLFAQSNNYLVRGEIANCNDTEVSMTIWNSEGTVPSSMAMNGGKFIMEGYTQEPMMVRVEFSDRKIYKYVPDGGYIPLKCSSLWFIVYPGANVKVKGELSDFVNAYPFSDKENDILAELTKVIFPLMNEYGNINVTLESDSTLTQEQKGILAQKMTTLDKTITEHLNVFVRKYPSSYAATWFLDDMMLRRQISPAEAEGILAKIDVKYQDNVWFKSAKQRANSVRYAVGAKMPEIITTNTVDNSKLSSSELLKGNYLLIDFWGTWCGPCMSGMDAMRKFRDDNKGKIEILGIAKDGRDGWLASIKNKNLNWFHILNGKDEQDYVAKFNVTGYPTKLLIAPDGTILYRESGESESFYEKIKTLIK